MQHFKTHGGDYLEKKRGQQQEQEEESEKASNDVQEMYWKRSKPGQRISMFAEGKFVKFYKFVNKGGQQVMPFTLYAFFY